MSNPSIKRTLVTAELSTGHVVETRVLYSDQIQLDRTIKARGWSADFPNGPEGNAFITWLALRRDGQLAACGLGDLSYEEFLTDALVDLDVRRVEADTHAGTSEDEGTGDPT